MLLRCAAPKAGPVKKAIKMITLQHISRTSNLCYMLCVLCTVQNALAKCADKNQVGRPAAFSYVHHRLCTGHVPCRCAGLMLYKRLAHLVHCE